MTISHFLIFYLSIFYEPKLYDVKTKVVSIKIMGECEKCLIFFRVLLFHYLTHTPSPIPPPSRPLLSLLLDADWFMYTPVSIAPSSYTVCTPHHLSFHRKLSPKAKGTKTNPTLQFTSHFLTSL